MEPAEGAILAVSRDGRLEFFRPATGERLRCSVLETAMWIALCQNAWNPADAAARLACVWEADPAELRELMAEWVEELCALGFLKD
jgi:hypothetical protein